MLTILVKYFSPFVRNNEELSLIQIFKPLYVILSAIGLFPISIEFPRAKNNLAIIFKSASINSVCTLFVPVVISVFFALHMLQLRVADGKDALRSDELAQTNYNIQLASQLLVSTVAFICAFKYKKLYIKVLNGMVESWAELPNIAKGSDKILGYLRVQVNCAVLGSLFIVLVMQFAVTCTDDVTAWKSVLLFLTFVLPELVQFTLVAFYFVMILMVEALLKNIEEHFKILFHIRLIRSMGNDYVGVGLGSAPASLCQLRSAYAHALAVKRQVNEAFQVPLLFILAQSFHTLVSNAHTLYHGLTYRNGFDIHNLFECCCWSLFQILKFYSIGHSGAILKQQANRVGRALYDIPASVNEEIVLHLEIQHFSTLMAFHDTEINLHGFFPLEASLVFNVLASAATYLVILVQFDATD